MGLFSFLGEKKRKSPNTPAYQVSEYDKPASKQLFDTYSNRAAGKDVGFSEEDLTSMKGQAIDDSALHRREMRRQGFASNTDLSRTNKGTTGTSTLGAQRFKEREISSSLMIRSKALRDVAIRNAVLKRQEQSEGIQGLSNFLNDERGEMSRRSGHDMKRFAYDWENQKYNHDVSVAKRKGWIDVGEKAAYAAFMSCHVAAELYGGWFETNTMRARFFINFHAPKWFKKAYIKHGVKVAGIIAKYPILKRPLYPIFNLFARKGQELWLDQAYSNDY